MHKIKEALMNELYEYEEKAKKMSGGKISTQELEKIHKLTDTVKNIDKIEMYEELGEEGMSAFEGGYSYRRGRGRNARRDSMGRYARAGGYSRDGRYSEEGGSSYASYAGGGRGGSGGGSRGGGGNSYEGGGYSRESGYSYDGAKDYMLEQLEEMMENVDTQQEREAIKRCMHAIEKA